MLIRSSRKRSLRLALVAGAATFATAGAAMAQDDSTEVGEVVVTARHYVPTTNVSATKTDTPLVETPASISVITRDQIDVLNMTNLQQAVRYTAGTTGETFGVDSRFDWLTVRGFKPVEFIDGIQAPVGSVSTVGLDLWGAGSIEVLKGPAGTLYGATPPGGIVNFTSRRPESAYHGEIQGLIGEFNDYQGAFDFTGSVLGDGKVDVRLTGLYRQSESQVRFADTERRYIAPAVTWNISDDTHWTLMGFYQKDENHGGDGGFLPAQGTLLPNPNGHISIRTNVGEPDYNFFGRELWGAGWEYSHKINDNLTFAQDLKYMRQNENFVSVYGQGLEADLRTLDRNVFLFPEDIKNFGVDTRLQIKAATGMVEHTGLVGVDYLDVNYTNGFGFGFLTAPKLDIFHPVYGGAVPTPATFYSKTTAEQTGVYAQDTMKIDRWRITLNAREDHLQGSVKDDAFTWRAGVNYIFDSGLAPYVAYATSFQPVNGTDANNNPFSPTKGEQYEAGLKFEPRHMPRYVKWFASAAVYQLTQRDVLTNDPDTVNHPFKSVQAGQVEVQGLELESVARIRERLTINASYSYTDSEVTRSNGPDLHKDLPAVPKRKAALLVDYTFQEGTLAGLGGGVGVRYLGKAYGDAANTLLSDSNTLTDLLIHYDMKSKWRLALNANNVFDRVIVQSCSDLNTCFYSQGRQVVFTVGRKW